MVRWQPEAELRAAAATGSSSTYVSPSESVRRKEIKTLQPVTVKRALVHATSVLTTRDGERVLSVDMRPLVIHLLAGLEQAGILHAVITLGHDAAHMAECVTAYGFTERAMFLIGCCSINAALRQRMAVV